MANRNKNTRTVNEERSEKREERVAARKKGKRQHRRTDTKVEPTLNDPNWYFSNPELMDQASMMSIDALLGVSDGPEQTTVPTILSLHMCPSPGISVNGDITAGINMAAQRMYAQLSSITGRTSAYAPQDIATLLLALGEVLSLISHIRRTFGVVNIYNQRNRAVPKQLVAAMGVDFDDLVANLANYRVLVNTQITRANKIPFPVNIAYLAKCNDMYNNIYMDEESSTAQLYVFRPEMTWVLNETADSKGSKLDTVEITGTVGFQMKPLSTWISVLQSQLDALLNSSTLNVIYADILNMANRENVPLVAIPIIETGYVVAPVYNEGILEQIHNMTVTGELSFTTQTIPTGYTPSNDVLPTASKNAITYNPMFRAVNTMANNAAIAFKALGAPKILVDFFDDKPSTERRVESTRLITALDYASYDDSSKLLGAISLPDHFCTRARIFAADWEKYSDRMWQDSYVLGNSSVSLGFYGVYLMLTQFKHAPAITFYFPDSLSNPTAWRANYDGFPKRMGELNYYTVLSQNKIERINRLIAMSLFELR